METQIIVIELKQCNCPFTVYFSSASRLQNNTNYYCLGVGPDINKILRHADFENKLDIGENEALPSLKVILPSFLDNKTDRNHKTIIADMLEKFMN